MPYSNYEPPPQTSPYTKMLAEYAEAASRALARRKALLARITELQEQNIPTGTDVLQQRADLLRIEAAEIRAAMDAIQRYTNNTNCF